ncbi:8-oxo-dGTP diphosphatase [Alkalihalobacillus xiaoxiensis]|uniref:8-oxo-dGTP diphosphatase n=1 Tax=Shouchella xiaoxiensis TaxID=766895 RepID=A0ABS2SW70_9BACI|nr:NUDIX hydrolase [Shouchella xiaoxiensis]MBM7839261.1 8-oxo-dGTP diphosphatase [Shouchella xiaoxiensis]
MNTYPNNNGFSFLRFEDANSTVLSSHTSLSGSMVILQVNKQVLLCYNTLRKQWELPAGKREANETPLDCAIRELYEETGQRSSNLSFLGFAHSTNRRGLHKINPIYQTTKQTIDPFITNNETSAIRLWDLTEPIGAVAEVDFHLLFALRERHLHL